jgi:fatty-acyl-CoA synthase
MPFQQPTLGSLYAQCLRQNPSNVAVIDGERRVTYAELADHVGRLLGVFADLGMRPGHRVGLGLTMGFDFVVCYVACHIGGLAVADLPPAIPDDIIRHRVTVAGLQTVIFDSALLGPRLSAAAQELGCRMLPTTSNSGAPNLRDLAADRAPAPIIAVESPDYATINYSGGTTGKPKAEGFTGAAAAALTLIMLANLPYPTRPVTVAYRTSAPVLAFNFSPALLRGGTVVTIPEFDLDQIVAKSKEFGADILFLATRALYALIDLPGVEWMRGQVKLIFHGGDTLVPSRARELVARFGRIFAQFYGTSESGQSAVLLPGDHDPDRPDVLRSVGRPMVGTEFEIRNTKGIAMPRGELGEIAIRSPARMSGYIGLPEQTTETVKNGWIHTGDVGRLSEDGYVYIVDRTSNAIVSAGRVLYPSEVDAVMTEHPAVSGSVTMGIAGPDAAQQVRTTVVLRQDCQASVEQLEAFAASRCASAGTRILILDQFPLSVQALKIDRLKLRQIVEKHFAERGNSV